MSKENVEDENMNDASVVESDQDKKTSTPKRGPRGKKRKPGWEAVGTVYVDQQKEWSWNLYSRS